MIIDLSKYTFRSCQFAGGKASHHPGNKLYRKLISAMKLRYMNTEDKDDKTDMSQSIVDKISSDGGRFVKTDEKTGYLYVLTKAEARMKCAQVSTLAWTVSCMCPLTTASRT